MKFLLSTILFSSMLSVMSNAADQWPKDKFRGEGHTFMKTDYGSVVHLTITELYSDTAKEAYKETPNPKIELWYPGKKSVEPCKDGMYEVVFKKDSRGYSIMTEIESFTCLDK